MTMSLFATGKFIQVICFITTTVLWKRSLTGTLLHFISIKSSKPILNIKKRKQLRLISYPDFTPYKSKHEWISLTGWKHKRFQWVSKNLFLLRKAKLIYPILFPSPNSSFSSSSSTSSSLLITYMHNVKERTRMKLVLREGYRNVTLLRISELIPALWTPFSHNILWNSPCE